MTSRRVLTTLDRLQFATADQLIYWIDVSQSTVSNTLSALCDANYVCVDKVVKPYIYSLTLAGRRAINSAAPKKAFYSAAVKRHSCHRNQIEIVLRKRYQKLTFQPRKTWLKYGLNPAFGEHGAKDVDVFTLILLDDYLMDSVRIPHSWTRPHTANVRYWQHPQIRHWQDVVSRFVVVCTDEVQQKRHRTYLNTTQLNTPVDVMFVKPLWENVC